MSVDIAAENSLTGTYNFGDMHTGTPTGDLSVMGFAREVSVNVGEDVHFCVNGPATVIRIFRWGWYQGTYACREFDTIANTSTVQAELAVIPDTNGATSATHWVTTATWSVPEDAPSGMYSAMIRNAAGTDAFYADFTVRDDDAEVDIIYKTSDTTWRAAYNHFGTKANVDGSNVYGAGTGVGNIMSRSLAVSYHRPVLTRGGVNQTYWWACELPLIRFLERQGYRIKYVTSLDLDQQGKSLLQKGKVFISSGHDEYWTQNMWDAAQSWRDEDGGKSIFMSGNEVFWRARFEMNGDEPVMYCYKDTMPGPTGFTRNPGDAFDPVTWTGTWIDTRWPERTPMEFLTGTRFGMNGVYDYGAVIPQNPYGGLKVWGGSALVDSNITLTEVIGFEADHVAPTQPEGSYRYLARYTRAAPGGLSDANGQNYNVPGNIEWGIVSQRFAGGGLTIGFGTCQWSWVLDGTHDRGIGVSAVSLAAQQFTVNLLNDLGATPETLMAGITLQDKNSLDEYGLIPAGEESTGTNWSLGDGTPVHPAVLRSGELIPLY